MGEVIAWDAPSRFLAAAWPLAASRSRKKI